jgi:hypothetical protein
VRNNVFWDCVDCVQDVFSDKREEKCCQIKFYACRIPYRMEKKHDVTVDSVMELRGLKQGKMFLINMK